MNILVTGGSGFIGSHFIEEVIKREDVEKVYNIDCNTYASNKNLPFQNSTRYQKLTLDISTPNFSDSKKYRNKYWWNFQFVGDVQRYKYQKVYSYFYR
jgi:dTDP-D-glucose 4,6-dehydratase